MVDDLGLCSAKSGIAENLFEQRKRIRHYSNPVKRTVAGKGAHVLVRMPR